ncbi:CU044_2847 family protein [Kitasatospora phosalacinea]|uniref:CU044_2847 family protein n=1 Tax=Kitasatospora phosalacinea TaxID=2065 RepID=UPI00068F4BB3|nr:CU044_2847 family protein [Kitasatospora phosalacinea]
MTNAPVLDTVEIALEDGTVLHAAVRQGPGRPAGDAGAVSSAVTHGLGEVRRTVRSVGRWARETAREAGDPDEFEVEFGLTLGMKSGRLIGVLAEATGEASLVVRLSWRRPDDRTAE